MPRLSALEVHEGERNGFSPEQLAEYQAERDRAAGFTDFKRGEVFVQSFVPGNVVTTFQRPRPPLRYESAMQHKPFKW